MTERSGALQEDPLYMSYAQIIARSCGQEEEEGGGEEGEEGEGGASIHVSYIQITYTLQRLYANNLINNNHINY